MSFLRRSLALACLVLVPALAGIARAAPGRPIAHAGRWITDAHGRVVIVHGVNMVDKLAPYYPQAVGFGADDAAFLSRIGFNAVRVGVIWKALEPAPGVYDRAYLGHIAATVATLARHGILSLLDFHQDLYNERFQGEGAPDWAVKDDGLPALPKSGFPGNYELMPALQHAFDSFWNNRPGPGGIGLQDRFAAAWRTVAKRFRSVPGVLGYELFNEPFPGSPYLTCVAPAGCPAFDAKLTAFNRRVARAIRTVDHHSLIWSEPNVLFDFGFPTNLGGLGGRGAGFAFHDYCFTRSPHGCPSESAGFAHAVAHVTRTHEALLLTEFGSNPFAADLNGMVTRADRAMVPWIEWSYCPCRDPTGATPDPLVLDPAKPPIGSNLGSLGLHSLVEPYPQAIAGTPLWWSFAAATRTFSLHYSTARAGRSGVFSAATVSQIATPAFVYPDRYAARVSGGAIVSRPGASILQIAACPHARKISVSVAPRGRSHSSCRVRR